MVRVAKPKEGKVQGIPAPGSGSRDAPGQGSQSDAISEAHTLPRAGDTDTILRRAAAVSNSKLTSWNLCCFSNPGHDLRHHSQLRNDRTRHTHSEDTLASPEGMVAQQPQ